jgi:hypothetical protein
LKAELLELSMTSPLRKYLLLAMSLLAVCALSTWGFAGEIHAPANVQAGHAFSIPLEG